MECLKKIPFLATIWVTKVSLDKGPASIKNRKCSKVQGSTFSTASDRRSGQFDRKRDSSVAESDTRVKERDKIEDRSPRKKCWFCHIITKYHVPDPPASPVMYRTGISQEVGNGGQVCGDVEADSFPV